MTEIRIKSSNIKALFYDETQKLLLCFFNSGSLYTYEDVSKHDALNIESDGGSYFYKHIREKKNHTKIY